jgi:hypothetical protein
MKDVSIRMVKKAGKKQGKAKKKISGERISGE